MPRDKARVPVPRCPCCGERLVKLCGEPVRCVRCDVAPPEVS